MNMKKGYYKIIGEKNCYAMIDGEKYSFEEFDRFVHEILYMLIMDGNTPACMLHEGAPIGRRIATTIRSSHCRILRAAGWKRAE